VSVKGGIRKEERSWRGIILQGDCFLAMGREPRGAVRLVCSD
jgi:hypothetical protein